MLKEVFELVRVADDIKAKQKDEENTKNIVKAVFHSLIIPFLLFEVYGPLTSAIYFGFVCALYITIFRYKSGAFWTAVAFEALFILIIIWPNEL